MDNRLRLGKPPKLFIQNNGYFKSYRETLNDVIKNDQLSCCVAIFEGGSYHNGKDGNLELMTVLQTREAMKDKQIFFCVDDYSSDFHIWAFIISDADFCCQMYS